MINCPRFQRNPILNGQFGEINRLIIYNFQLETFSHQIAYVDSSNAAIVCLTTSGLMLLYAKFKVKSLKKPIVHETIKHVAVVGGSVDNANIQEKCESFVIY